MEPRQKVQALQYQNRVEFIPVQSIRKVRGCLQGIDTTIVLVEVTQRVLQQRDEDAALQIAAMLHQGRVVLLDAGLAVSAARRGAPAPAGRQHHLRDGQAVSGDRVDDECAVRRVVRRAVCP